MCGVTGVFLVSYFVTLLLILYKTEPRAFRATCPLWSTKGSIDCVGTNNLGWGSFLFLFFNKKEWEKLKPVMICKNGKEGQLSYQGTAADGICCIDPDTIKKQSHSSFVWEVAWGKEEEDSILRDHVQERRKLTLLGRKTACGPKVEYMVISKAELE